MNVAAEVFTVQSSGADLFLEDMTRQSLGLSSQDITRDVPHNASLPQRNWNVLCAQLLSVSEEMVSDEDLLALLLSYFDSTIDSRKLAMQLIKRFETFGSAVNARTTRIGDDEIQPEILAFLRVVSAAGTRLAREEISHRPILDAWDKLIKYLRTTMAHQVVEQFRVLFLDRRNMLIADEVQHRGTIDHTPVYPREVAKRALELDASAIVMVHNHPSNRSAPSKADIEMTKTIRDILVRLGIVLHESSLAASTPAFVPWDCFRDEEASWINALSSWCDNTEV